MAEHLDTPFDLVQTNKPLKMNNYTPAMTHWLFAKDENRTEWAVQSWIGFKRNITATEFEWSVRESLLQAMQRVQLSALQLDFLPQFWIGVEVIIEKLDRNLITHSLRAMDIDICRLALDHLQVDSGGFKHLLICITRILNVSPADFWEAMGAIPAREWIEQFFNSPALKSFLEEARSERTPDSPLLEQLFAWMNPFLNSSKPVNQPPVCRAIILQLMGTIQESAHVPVVKDFCYELGLHLIANTLKSLNDDTPSMASRATTTEALDLVEQRIINIGKSMKRTSAHLDTAAYVIRQALELDIKGLTIEAQHLFDKLDPFKLHATIWRHTVKNFETGNTTLAREIILALKGLTGLERFVAPKTGLSKEKTRWNDTFDAVNKFICDILDRLNEFSSSDLQQLFEEEDVVNVCILLLSASDVEVRAAQMEVLKTMTGQVYSRDVLKSIMRDRPAQSMNAMSLSLTQISNQKTFAPTPNMLKLSTDVLEILCDTQDGILRSQDMDSKTINAAESYWQALWQELITIYTTTETWSTMGRDKQVMMPFVGDTMDLAARAFDQFGVFAGVLGESVDAASHSTKTAGSRMIEQPMVAMDSIVKWLKLRDDQLVAKAAALVGRLLSRFKEFGVVISEASSQYLEDVSGGRTRTMLNDMQKAELHRALETNLGRSIALDEEDSKEEVKAAMKSRKAAVIDLDKWQSKAKFGAAAEYDIEPADHLTQAIKSSSRSVEAFKAMQATKKPVSSILHKVSTQPKPTDMNEFMKKRAKEVEERKKRDALAVANAKKRINANGVAGMTAEEGSGLAGLGLAGKDHSAPKGTGMMVSSGESSDESEDEMDRELFGMGKKDAPKSAAMKAYEEDRARKKRMAKQQVPVKKQRIIRSARDMRARLAPDLSPLHKSILGWEYFHDGPYPPGTGAQDYSAVLSTFRDPLDYQNTFQPLLILEAWNQFLKAKEDNTSRPYEISIVNRSSVDAFIEVSSTMSHPDSKEIGEGDIVLLSRAQNPASDAAAHQPHCLSRVFRMTRKKAHVEVLYRVIPGSEIVKSLNPQSKLQGLKITSIVPLEREYGALLGLQYFDLCDEISKARPSPLLTYTDTSLSVVMDNYGCNKAQAKAVKCAIDNDGFTLIQGPPGTGKTKTIIAIVGALLSETLRNVGTIIHQPGRQFPTARNGPMAKKLLVCAPSNAAVDELVMRFKDGVKTFSGEHRKVNVVRIGRSEAINANVTDVTLEELVNKRLNVNPVQDTAREETQKIMMEHKLVSEKLREAREKLDEAEEKKLPTMAALHADMDALRRRKIVLSQQIEIAKEKEGAQSRTADLNRRRAQQEIIDESHVICATLSGSGHDMFQNLNVEFETVVIDEAAQCVELSALIPLKYGCAKCILVGDPKQLPPTVFSKEAARFKYEQSLFVRMQSNQPQDVHLLDTQYRMHPEISIFPSSAFYDGRLLDGPNMGPLRTRPWHATELLGPFRFFDVQGQHQAAPKGHSLVNYAEVRIAMQLFNRLTIDFGKSYDFAGKIGIITPYKSQLRELKEQFRRNFPSDVVDGIEFNTTDAFQGRESEVIIFSCVRASPAGGIGFLQDIRRMNVGLTRAKSSLWVLGNSNSLVKGEYWGKLVNDARHRGRFTDGDLEGMLKNPSRMVRKVEDGTEKQRRQSDVKMGGVEAEPLKRPVKAEISRPLDHRMKAGVSATHIKKEIKVTADAKLPLNKRKLSSSTVDAKVTKRQAPSSPLSSSSRSSGSDSESDSDSDDGGEDKYTKMLDAAPSAKLHAQHLANGSARPSTNSYVPPRTSNGNSNGNGVSSNKTTQHTNLRKDANASANAKSLNGGLGGASAGPAPATITTPAAALETGPKAPPSPPPAAAPTRKLPPKKKKPVSVFMPSRR